MPKTNHKTYIKNEYAIWRELDIVLETRKIDLNITDLCAAASISKTTFYTHHSSLENALSDYEKTIKGYFVAELLNKNQREVVYTILLTLIRRYKHYFRSTFRAHNMHLLTGIFMELRPVLVGNDIDIRQYIVYMASAQAIIACWGLYDKFSYEMIAYYTKRLSRMRVMNYEAIL